MRSFLSIPVLDFLAPALSRVAPSPRLGSSSPSRFASTSALPISSEKPSRNQSKPHQQKNNTKAGLRRIREENDKPPKSPRSDPNIIEGIAIGPAREVLRRNTLKPHDDPFRDSIKSKSHQTKYGIIPLAIPLRRGLQERSSPSSLDPFNVLSQIRKSAEMKPRGNSEEGISGAANSLREYDQAVRNVVTRNVKGHVFYRTAFVAGWRPIRLAGSADNLNLEDVLKVLNSVIVEMGREGSDVSWEEVKDLMLYLATKKGMRGLVDFAWSDLSRGEIGAKRIIELYTCLMEGDHIKLRDEGRIGFSKPLITSDESVEIPHRLFGAYITAKAMLHSPTIPFIEIYPQFLNPFHPTLRRFEAAAEFKTLTTTALKNESIEIANRVYSWIRQISLAQIWSKQGGNGLEIARQVNSTLRKGESITVWELWERIQEGFQKDGQVNWIQDGWKGSAETHLIDGVVSLDIGMLDPSPSEEDANLSTISTEIDILPPSTEASIIKPAILTQAIVACFLSGFTRVEKFDEANSIWEWLSSQSLKPGLVVWCGLLSGYASNGNVEAAEVVFADMKLNGIIPDARAWIYLAQAHFNAKDPVKAMSIFNKMLEDKNLKQKKLDAEIYIKIIGGLLSNKSPEDAQVVFKTMLEEGIVPDIKIINLFIKYHTFGARPNLSAMVATLRLVDEHSLTPDVFTFTMVLQALLRLDQKGATKKLIKIMDSINIKPSITTYGTLISNLALTGRMPELQSSVELLDEMERSGITTNEIIYTSLIQGYLRAISNNPMHLESDQLHPCFDAALTLKTRMENKGITLNRIGLNAIISTALSLQTLQGIELALATFETLRLKSNRSKSKESMLQADTWYILLDGFLNMDDFSRARGVLAEMDRIGFIAKSQSLKKLVDVVRRGGRRW